MPGHRKYPQIKRIEGNIIVFDVKTVSSEKLTEVRVDASDWEKVLECHWRLSKRGYVYGQKFSGGKSKTVMLHRHLMGYPDSQVDHADRDKTNCTKANLRPCTSSQNNGNRSYSGVSKSGFMGVHFRKDTGKYRVKVVHRGKKYLVGSFDDPYEAALAYDKKKEELFGEFAYVNFPDRRSS